MILTVVHAHKNESVDVPLAVARRELLDVLDAALLTPDTTVDITVVVTTKSPTETPNGVH